MLSPFTRLSRTPFPIWSAVLLSAVLLVLAGLLGALSRSQQPAPEPIPVVVQALPTSEPGSTPRPLLPSVATRSVLIEPLNTPAPLPTDTPLPVAPTSIVPPIAPTTIELLSTPTLPPTLPSPTSKRARPSITAQAVSPKPDLLPNGARYGERKPNIPSRIVRIASDDIQLDTPVYEVYAPKGIWEVADYAGGHHYDSMNPGGGGNIVVSGHNNWRGEVFRYLEFLKLGNTINVWTLDGKKYTYKVRELKKLKETGVSMAQRLENAKVMDPTSSEQLTLITCWPYKTFTHRLIVIADPVK